MRVLKNTSGLKSEIKHSKGFHAEGLPLLISAQLLRTRDLGQIDLCRVKKDRGEWLIEVGEVKSSSDGIMMMSKSQRYRLNDSQKFLTAVFGHRGRILTLSN